MSRNLLPPGALAVVTGATSGIGAAYAGALAARGLNLLLTGRRAAVLDEVAHDLQRRYGVRVETVLADFADHAALETVADRVSAAAGLGVLVNNAGYGHRVAFLQDTAESQLAMLRVHAEATARLSHAAVPRIAEAGGGAIVNVASLAAFLPSPDAPMYCATKAFIVSFSESLAMAVRGMGIRVQALCPGFTRTHFHARLGLGEQQLRRHGPPWWMSAEAVVRSSLAALRRGRVVCVPGTLNTVALALLRALPRGLYYAGAQRVRLAPSASKER